MDKDIEDLDESVEKTWQDFLWLILGSVAANLNLKTLFVFLCINEFFLQFFSSASFQVFLSAAWYLA